MKGACRAARMRIRQAYDGRADPVPLRVLAHLPCGQPRSIREHPDRVLPISSVRPDSGPQPNLLCGTSRQRTLLVSVEDTAGRVCVDLWSSYRHGSRFTLRPALHATLFGMGAIFLTPFIFLVVRESKINSRILRNLLILSCAVSLLSQLGVLARSESYAAGYVDLAPLLGISRSSLASLDYQETTITIWRALSVGLTIALLASRCGALMKLCGLAGALLQFGGGGGGRSQLIFLSLGVLVVLMLARSQFKAGLARKVVLAGVLSLGLATLYLWAPAGGGGAVKGSYRITH